MIEAITNSFENDTVVKMKELQNVIRIKIE